MEYRTIVLSLVFFVLLCLEVLFPYFEQRGKIKHLFSNGILVLFNAVIINLLFVPVILFSTSFSFGLFHQFMFSFWIELILTVLLIDCLTYWLHVLYHKVPFFWKFHKVHHSDTQMDVSTGSRFHIGEHAVSMFARAILYAVFGMNFEIIVLFEIVFVCSVFFHHANITLSEPVDRVWRIFFTSPNMHKVHHSNIQSETDSNYTSLFSFWDRLFGTFQIVNTKKITFGIKGLEKEQSPWRMLKTPWKRK